MLAIARLAQKYAIRVHYDPLAGRGPCGRTPLQDNQFPIRGANGHKGRALQMADTTHERPEGSRLSPQKAEGLSAISASHSHHLRGSTNSAAPREKTYTLLRESTCITARVSWGWGSIEAESLSPTSLCPGNHPSSKNFLDF